jgi:hypothetical protein
MAYPFELFSADSKPIKRTLTHGKGMIKEDAQDCICVDGWYSQKSQDSV